MTAADLFLTVLIVWVAARAWHHRHEGDGLGEVEPRQFMEGGQFWRHGRLVRDRWDSAHAQRAAAARRQMDEYPEAA